MTVGSLFAGIGGFELAAQWSGLTPVWSNEIDPFCCKVLRKNFKHEIIEADIRTIGKHNLKPVDILTGGFPCQPFSTSGSRKGTEDYRWLWPEMFRVAREIRPSWIVAENVYGLINWGKGVVFERVQTDLENEGYQVLANILPACGVSAPHGRERIWFIAHANRKHCTISIFKWRQIKTGNTNFSRSIQCRPITYASAFRRIQSKQRHESGQHHENRSAISWERFPIVSPVRSRNDGLPTRLVRHSIAASGNAIVPQVAVEIFKAIKMVTTQ